MMSQPSWTQKNVYYKAELYRWEQWSEYIANKKDRYPSKIESIHVTMFGDAIPIEIGCIILFKYVGWDVNYVYWNYRGWGPEFTGKPDHAPTPPTSDDDNDDENDARMIEL